MADSDSEENVEKSWKFWRGKRQSDGLPLCDLSPTCHIASLRYVRSMYANGQGLALWDSEVSSYGKTHTWRTGVMIGDVGYFDLSFGRFRQLFNIFYDVKRPTDHATRIPDNFVPIQPPFEQWEVTKSPGQFAKGTILTSEGIEVTRELDSLDFTFNCPVDEGSILVLPEGADREDLVVTQQLYEYCQLQALEWFQFLEEYDRSRTSVSIANGSLTLVTGFDKAKDWSTFTCWRYDGKSDELGPSGSYDHNAALRWSQPEAKSYRYGRAHRTRKPAETAAVFIRGLRLGLNPDTWKEYLPTNIPGFVFNVATFPTLRTSSNAVRDPIPRSLTISREAGLRDTVLHPAHIVLPIMMSQVSKRERTRLFALDDALWLPLVVQGQNLTWNNLLCLVAHILAEHRIVQGTGITYLARKSKPKSAQGLPPLKRVLSLLHPSARQWIEKHLTARTVQKSVKVIIWDPNDD